MSDKPVMNIHEADGFPMGPTGGSDRFGAKVVPVGSKIGLSGLGCMYVQVEPGKRAFPFHNHLGNDEMFVILEGTGTYRFGNESFEVKPGDVCGAPKGAADTAHQLVNTGDKSLKYLGISTSVDPDVVEYPDSGKYAAIAIAPGPHFMQAHLRALGRKEDSLDYWDGEET